MFLSRGQSLLASSRRDFNVFGTLRDYQIYAFKLEPTFQARLFWTPELDGL